MPTRYQRTRHISPLHNPSRLQASHTATTPRPPRLLPIPSGGAAPSRDSWNGRNPLHRLPAAPAFAAGAPPRAGSGDSTTTSRSRSSQAGREPLISGRRRNSSSSIEARGNGSGLIRRFLFKARKLKLCPRTHKASILARWINLINTTNDLVVAQTIKHQHLVVALAGLVRLSAG